ncbi:MAG: 3-deoxy-8-phosphooctulonate synthase [Deltaproteobacteria bacterium]|nr:3-deoxy-8-phosphooctulonate synthase [Deltaproteobacteria bacterium]
MTATVQIGKVRIGGGALVLIAGPCVIESESLVLKTAERLKRIAADARMPLIFKSSFDKANRSSYASFRGPGLTEGLKILQRVREEFDLPVLSDVHREEEVGPAAEIIDVLQVPALLCRQTDFLMAVARSGRAVNVKKGQFMAPWDMKNVVEKIRQAGNEQIILTERGSSFGYNNLVSDMRSLPVMRDLGVPVVFDGTHSVQLPGGQGTVSGGQREFVPALTRAAVAAGVDGIFLEVHPDPDRALCDGPNMLALSSLPELLRQVIGIHAVVSGKESERS